MSNRACRQPGKHYASVLALMGIAWAALLAPTALAGPSHAYKHSFGSASSTPPNPYPLSSPTDVAVDQSAHAVYVNDPSHYRVEKFDSTGNFLFMFGKRVNKTAVENGRLTEVNLCPATGHPGDLCQAGSPGSQPGQFQLPDLLAIDNSGGPSAGSVYVADPGIGVVQKFDSAGHIVSTWGTLGQKDGTESGRGSIAGLSGLAVGANGDLQALLAGNGEIKSFTESGVYLGATYVPIGRIKIDPDEFFYVGGNGGGPVYKAFNTHQKRPEGEEDSEVIGQITSVSPTLGFALDPADNSLYQNVWEQEGHGAEIVHYSPNCEPADGVCDPIDTFGEGHLFEALGMDIDGASGSVYVANSETADVAVFQDIRPSATTAAPSDIKESGVRLNGHVDLGNGSAISDCRFEYGFTSNYEHSVPCEPDAGSNPPSSHFSGPTDVSAVVTGFSSGTANHYRVVVSNTEGASGASLDTVFTTASAPSVEGLNAENLTATTADLVARVNPNGLDTRYHFEYGTTPEYGLSVPVAPASLGSTTDTEHVEAHLTGLTPQVPYHYRLVAENVNGATGEGGTTMTEDHVFNFYPPSCPNSNVRQQTHTNYLPDCRAYELVSPADAGGTLLYVGAPNSAYATSPSRFSFTGLWGAIPNSGGSPMNTAGDLYVATRTATGWVTKYVGPPSDRAAVVGGPAQGLPGSATRAEQKNYSTPGGANGAKFPDDIHKGVLSDPGMNNFLLWDDGSTDNSNETPVASNAPYVWNAGGTLVDRWPTNLATVPAGNYPEGTEFSRGGTLQSTSAAGAGALDCVTADGARNFCPGDVTASEDLSHFVFASRWNVFAAGGILSAPGSVYDNDTGAGSVVVASKTPNGTAIPSEPTNQAGDPLQIPMVSSNGSHILMAAGVRSPCEEAFIFKATNCGPPWCTGEWAVRCPMAASHLYMRVDAAVTYDVSQGHAVNYEGSTPDGSEVYFTSDDQLTPSDHDSSVDLYMWSETGELAGDPLKLVSIGAHGEGNSDACENSFTSKCGIVTYSNKAFCEIAGGRGGNCSSDTAIASQTGDIYFFSPELLDGSHGVPNELNLYLSRNGTVEFVASFSTGKYCRSIQLHAFESNACSSTPAVRMEVTPSGNYMAFVTASPVTSYDNGGRLEMYRYEPATRALICVSCLRSGDPPKTDVGGSQNGRFMTDDGRVFFSTEEALALADTNRTIDIYEYVEGRPQLITPGTGETRTPTEIINNPPGLSGVSADGRDVYFSTFDTLVSQDRNGLTLKYYDARTGGGFYTGGDFLPCEAADECHGVSSGAPVALADGTSTPIAGGNVAQATKTKKKAHRGSKKHRRKRNRNKGGSR